MSTKPSTYAEAGRNMAKAAKKAKAAPKPEKKAEAPLAPFLTGDKRGLPMKPPQKGGGK